MDSQHPHDPAEQIFKKDDTDSSKYGETLISGPEDTNVSSNADCSQNNENGGGNPANSSPISEEEQSKLLELACELMERGSAAVKDGKFVEATDYFSRSLEIRVSRYGELSPECVHSYYKYGCALLYKAQEEADPIAGVPKNDVESVKPNGSKKMGASEESTTASVSNNLQDEDGEDASSGNEDEEEEETEDGKGSGAEELEEATDDDDESDLDLSWKMLDIARAISERDPSHTMEKVDILSSLAEVALEREDVESSLGDYRKALSILEHLGESNSRHTAELNFRICLCMEIGSRVEEAIPYCEKALSICKFLVRDTSKVDANAENEVLSGLASELEKKLEDLHQLLSNPATSVLAEVCAEMKAKTAELATAPRVAVKEGEGFDSPSVPTTAQTTGSITHLGIVGRGVKRASTDPSLPGSPKKKPTL